MRSLYNYLFLAGFVLSSPYYFFRLWRRGNWVKGFGQRFARYSINLKQALTNRQILWLHAVSVGEMNICVELVRALQKRFPNVKIVVSTTTTTGMGELQKRLPAEVSKIYYPIDRPRYVARAIGLLHPTAIILVEAEIWPNFIWRAQDTGTPVILVNGRLSDRSYPRYRRFDFLFRPLFASLAAVGAQSEEHADRLRDVGCRPEVVKVLGNLKFDAAGTGPQTALDVASLLRRAGAPEGALLWVCGSTHDGEEVILGRVYRRLKAKFPDLYWVVVPRHFERAGDVGRVLSGKAGLRPCYRSQLGKDSSTPGGVDCLIVDTTGELVSFYQHATVTFIGKSLTAHGGQNPIEPAALGKPTVFGPHMENFTDVVRLLLKGGGAVQVKDAAQLEKAMEDLLASPERRARLGAAGQQVVRSNQGAIQRTVDLVIDQLRGTELYIASDTKTVS